jgi:arylsulfatase A-like enzyme
LREEGHSPGEFTNPGNPAIPWEGNPVSLSGRIRMARSQDWKLVQEEGGTNELYDLKNDPHELVNLSDAPVGKTAQAQLLRQLEDWKSSLPGIEIEAQQGVPSDA